MADTAQIIGMLAYDIADLIDRDNNYAKLFGDVASSDIERALPAFLAALGITAGQQNTDQATPADPAFKVHNCNPKNPGKALPFGRKQPGCPRCDELLAGATPRQAAPWIAERQRKAQIDADRQRAIARHYAPDGPYQRGECGAVCTHFEW